MHFEERGSKAKGKEETLKLTPNSGVCSFLETPLLTPSSLMLIYQKVPDEAIAMAKEATKDLRSRVGGLVWDDIQVPFNFPLFFFFFVFVLFLYLDF